MPSGKELRSCAKRWRRATSKATRPTSQGQRGGRSGLFDAADLEDEDPVGAERDGAAHGDRVHDAAVDEVLVADPDRRQDAGHRAGGEQHVGQGPGVKPVLGRALDAGGDALERHREVLDAGDR